MDRHSEHIYISPLFQHRSSFILPPPFIMDSDPDRTSSCYLVPYALSRDITTASKPEATKSKKKKTSLRTSKSMHSIPLKPIVSRCHSKPVRSSKHKKGDSKRGDSWRYSLCLPLYEQLRSNKKMFPHFTAKHAQFGQHPLRRLALLSTVTANGGTDSVFLGKVLRHYLTDKTTFRSSADFAVFKLNELEAISRGTRIPNRIRTAICCDLLESLIAADPTLSGMLRREFLFFLRMDDAVSLLL